MAYGVRATFTHIDRSHLRESTVAPRPVLEDWKDILTWAMPIFHVYGNMAIVCCPVHGKYKEGSVGVPLPDVDVRIVDAETGGQMKPTT
jgi:hypothetical protein